MPVLKTYKNGAWEPVSGMSGMADGGNADTLDGKHANEFALATDVEVLTPIIGTTDNIPPSQVCQALLDGRQIVLTHCDDNYGELIFSNFYKNDGEIRGVATNTDVTTWDISIPYIYLNGDIAADLWYEIREINVPFAEEVDMLGTADAAVSAHNTDNNAHADIRGQINQLSINKVDKLSLSLGIASDGLMYVFVNGQPIGSGITLPSGATGDVFGYVDENNTVVLNGNLVYGTYTIKYEMEDGSTMDIGELVLEAPVVPTGRLPAEYQEVEWVQIVNQEAVEVTSAVHTDIKWVNANKIVTKVQNLSSANNDDMIFSAWSSATAKAAPYIATRTSKNANMFAYTSGLSNFAVSPNNIASTNTDANTFTFTFTHTSTSDICFGSWHDQNFSHPHKWYFVEIYNGDTLLGNFIPCYRKADNVNGFYDLVSGNFYDDSGVSTSGSAFTFKYRGNDV